MSKPDYYIASDYAGLETDGVCFYYGYEHSICKECGKKNNGEFCDNHPDADRDWCFIATFNEQEIVIPFSKLDTEDMFDVTGNLLKGIGWIFSKYELAEKYAGVLQV